MSELLDYWNEYKLIENSGIGRNTRIKELELQIHRRQKELKTSPYDFDARWIKIGLMSTPTVSGPPSVDSKPLGDTSTNTIGIDEVRKDIGENDCSLLDYCTRWAEFRMVYIAHVADILNPENKNVARRGQVINLAMGKFNNMKNNGETIE